ncbi:MAG: PIN domain-containing protein [Myxococcaceae bacterium]|jgi:hypothetical protein|nr:PIN domain-containing protein [Myxococcaceae bacterium]
MKAGPWLLDTGFVVGLMNQKDPAHASCVSVWKEVRGPFITTEGLLVETGHLLRKHEAGLARAWQMLRAVQVIVVPPAPWRIERSLELMSRWADVPMDYVDASLVGLAEETGVLQVLTLDQRGFDAYRVGSRRFRRLP